jgi:NifU-like protein
MAKKDLISGALWEQYSQKVNDRMINPTHMGELTEEDAKRLGGKLVVADYGAEVCGDAIRLSLVVDENSDTILDARFKTFGCGTAIASSDVMTEMCIGKTVDEALTITNLDVEHALRDEVDRAAIPPQKMHCSVMAYDVIKKAVSLYKGIEVSELENEEIVCECARVSLGTIKEVIRLNDLKTVEEITQYTKAGAFCKSCIRPGGHEERKYYLVDILQEVRAEMEAEENQQGAAEKAAGAAGAAGTGQKPFAELNLIQKHRAVEQVLDEAVRPSLARDGGNLEVVDMKVEDQSVVVYISYLGACKGCASSQIGTLGFVEDQLKKQLDESIRVVSM